MFIEKHVSDMLLNVHNTCREILIMIMTFDHASSSSSSPDGFCPVVKAPEQQINGPCGEIILSTAVSKVYKKFQSQFLSKH